MRGMGIKQPMFFIGVVENNVDPTFQGRVQVRAFGVHGENTEEEIPTKALPWAICVAGNFDPNNPPPPLNSFVFGMFTDGDEGQHPLILGLVPGQYVEKHKPTEARWGVTPPYDGELLAQGSSPRDIGQPQNSRLARAEYLDETYLAKQYTNSKQNQKIADSEETWDEPSPAYAAKYPYNRVIETARHSIEIDDTPGAERIQITHGSGAYIQMDSKGSVTERAQGDRYEINIGTKHESSGHSVVTINGNSHVYVNGNKTEEIYGNYKQIVHGEHEVAVGGNSYHNAGLTAHVRGANLKLEGNAEDVTIFGRNNIKMESEKQINSVSGHIKNTALLTFSAYANKAVRFSAAGDIHLYSFGQIINTAKGLAPPVPGVTGSATVNPVGGFNINAPFVNIGGFSTDTIPTAIPTVVGINGLVNATTGNFGVLTAPTINCGLALNATAITAKAVNTTILAAPPPIAPSGGGTCLPGPGRIMTLPTVPAIPTIPPITIPAISLAIPSFVPGQVSGVAYPNGNGPGFIASVLTSPFSVFGFDINVLPQGGLGITRAQMPEPPTYNVYTKDNIYNAKGHSIGFCSDQDESQNAFTQEIISLATEAGET